MLRYYDGAALPDIAREESPRLGLPESLLEAYLRDNIHYDLGTEEIRSLWLFHRMCREAGLVPSARELVFCAAEEAGRERAVQLGIAP